jgi:hypothetical protein
MKCLIPRVLSLSQFVTIVHSDISVALPLVSALLYFLNSEVYWRSRFVFTFFLKCYKVANVCDSFTALTVQCFVT